MAAWVGSQGLCHHSTTTHTHTTHTHTTHTTLTHTHTHTLTLIHVALVGYTVPVTVVCSLHGGFVWPPRNGELRKLELLDPKSRYMKPGRAKLLLKFVSPGPRRVLMTPRVIRHSMRSRSSNANTAETVEVKGCRVVVK